MGYNDNKNAKSSQGEKGSSGRKRKDKGLQTFVVALSLLTTLCLLISIRSHVAVYPLRLATDECKEAGEDLLDGMVYICNGKGCDSSFLCYSMSLLRFESNWQGPIYVISDRQDFIAGTACDQNRPRYSVVVAPETPTMMHMKNFKRQLFDLIPAKNATSLIYIDADIVPVGCLHDFLAKEAPEDLGFFRDSWCAGCNQFLGGFVYMRKTEKTLECLREWIEESSKDDFKAYKKDQDALDNVLRKESICRIAIKTLSSSFIETFDDLRLLPLFGVVRGKVPTFQHFSHGIREMRIWRKIKSNIARQIDHVYEDDLHSYH